HHHYQSVRLLLLRRLRAYAEVAQPLESHCVVDRIFATPCGVYDESVSRVPALGLGPLRFRLGLGDFLLSGGADLRLATVRPKGSDIRSVPLHSPSAVLVSEHLGVWTDRKSTRLNSSHRTIS